MKKVSRYVGLALCLAIMCLVVMAVMGRTYVLEVRVPVSVENVQAFRTDIEMGAKEIARLTDQRLEDGVLYLSLHAVNFGKTYLHVTGPDGFAYDELIQVHRFGVTCVGAFFGECRGARTVPIAVILFLLYALVQQIRRYRADDVHENLYQYRNVRRLGLILYIVILILSQIPFVIRRSGLQQILQSLLSSASCLAYTVLSITFVVFVLVSIGNVQLMRREGVNASNIFDFLLGVAVCLGAALPFVMGLILYRTPLSGILSGRGFTPYIELGVRNVVLVAAVYLECILLSTVAAIVRAGKHVPSLDKDFILVFGGGLQKDGTLTKRLQGIADRAVEFARMQRDAEGPPLLFVPTGRQDKDEALPKGEAVRRYLLSVGIPEEQILAENFAANTEQNFLCAEQLILERTGRTRTRIAFATEDYQVFRAGWIAEHKGIKVEGIGSKTRHCFWINACIRELIDVLRSGRIKHILIVLGMSLLVFALTVGLYAFCILWS